MAWKNYSLVKCPACKGKAYRHGRTDSGYKRYKCANQKCNKCFDERDLDTPEPLNYLS